MPDVAMAIHRELSGENAHATATKLTAFHRPPGGAGYHAATSLVAERLRAAGLTDIIEETYPLDGETLGGHEPFPLAWKPYDATVKIVGPVQEPVVDLTTTSSCLAWRSTPTPPGGMTAELIDVGTGESDEDYAGKDIQGKIVLIGHTPRPGGWMHAAREATDKYFHTQLLTADNADPRALAAYEIADAGQAEASVIAAEVVARAYLGLSSEAHRAGRRAVAARRDDAGPDDAHRAVEWAARRLRYLAVGGSKAVESVLGLADHEPDPASAARNAAPGATLRQASEQLIEWLRGLLPGDLPAETGVPPIATTEIVAQVPRRAYQGPGTALSGSTYPKLVALVERMRAQDRTVIFDTLRPICDELWNLIDDRRSVGEIAEALVMQFDVQIDPEVLVPLFEGLARSGEIEL